MARKPRKPVQVLVPPASPVIPDTRTPPLPPASPLPPLASIDARLKKMEDRLTNLEATIGRIAARAAPRAVTADTLTYRAMRWHMRDGTGAGQPPWYYDPTHVLRRA